MTGFARRAINTIPTNWSAPNASGRPSRASLSTLRRTQMAAEDASRFARGDCQLCDDGVGRLSAACGSRPAAGPMDPPPGSSLTVDDPFAVNQS
jgi:hypothetical protein